MSEQALDTSVIADGDQGEQNSGDSDDVILGADKDSGADGKPGSDGEAEGGDAGSDAGTGDGAGDQGEEGKGADGSDDSDPYGEFEIPEGVEVDQERLGEWKGFFKELGLTKEQAQGLLTKQMERTLADAETAQASTVAAFNEMKTGWLNQSKQDKEFGGEKYQESLAAANKALATFGTPELKKVLTDYGLANHPEIIRVFYRTGLKMKESPVDDKGANALGKTPDRAEQLYPDAKKE